MGGFEGVRLLIRSLELEEGFRVASRGSGFDEVRGL